jgi:hypothetical protein
MYFPAGNAAAPDLGEASNLVGREGGLVLHHFMVRKQART